MIDEKNPIDTENADVAILKADENHEYHVDVSGVLEKFDRESSFRRFSGWKKWLITIVAVFFAGFQIYASLTYAVPTALMRRYHLGFVLLLAFLLYPVTKKSKKTTLPWYDYILAVVAFCASMYYVVNYRQLILRVGAYTQVDLWVGAVLLLCLIEACRRVVGLPILCVAIAFIGYTLTASHGPLSHRAVSLQRFISQMAFSEEGIMGTPMEVCSRFIFLFILFGSFLSRTGVSEFFIDFANAVAGNRRGGPAKVAVLSSALLGTVSGSSVANTVGSGSFTIPMMRKLGYKPEFAAAVEATASTGGQIMPPIMGAAAFLMAESLGVSYFEVVKAAIIPAILYFTGIWIMVDLEAKKRGLKCLAKEDMPNLKHLLFTRGHLFLPIVVIVYCLTTGYTPVYSAIAGMMSAVLVSFFRRDTRLKLYDYVEALESGARSIIGVAIACGMAGVIVGCIMLTGLGLTIGSTLVSMAGGSMILTLIFTMIASLILGMGVPTTANYLITSTIMAPAVIKLGVPALAAHMYTFYFGIMADITPPVALAAYAGSAIARSNPLKTGVTATKLAIAAFLIPYVFAFNPSLLLINTTIAQVVQIVLTSLIGMYGVATAMQGYMFIPANPIERMLLLAGGLMLIMPDIRTDILGVCIVGVLCAQQYIRYKRRERTGIHVL